MMIKFHCPYNFRSSENDSVVLRTKWRFLPDSHYKFILLAYSLVLRHKHVNADFAYPESGKLRSKLLGIITPRDIQFHAALDDPGTAVMSTELVTAKTGITLQEANDILSKSKKGKLPIIDEAGNLVSLLSRSDLMKNLNY